MSRIADHRTGYKCAILITVLAAALMSQAPGSVPGHAANGAARTVAPPPSPPFDASVPRAADVRFVGGEDDGSAIATF